MPPPPPPPFSMARILPKLYQGSAPPFGRWVGDHFKVLVLSADEHQPFHHFFPTTQEIVRLSLDDSGPPPTDLELDQARWAGQVVAERVLAQERTLVTCWQGRNRSGLVVALAVRRLLGVTGGEALTIVRMRRPGALTNDHFARLLQELPAPRRALLPNGPREPAVAYPHRPFYLGPSAVRAHRVGRPRHGPAHQFVEALQCPPFKRKSRPLGARVGGPRK